MGIHRKKVSMKQMAYAKRILGGKSESKKQAALDAGYSSSVAKSVTAHIENTKGFNVAMAQLAVDSNNLALAAMHEFKARGFGDFSNKELVGALNAIGNAWSRFNADPRKKSDGDAGNKLRTVVLQQIENQNINQSTPEVTPRNKPEPVSGEVVDVADVDEPLDF